MFEDFLCDVSVVINEISCPEYQFAKKNASLYLQLSLFGQQKCSGRLAAELPIHVTEKLHFRKLLSHSAGLYDLEESFRQEMLHLQLYQSSSHDVLLATYQNDAWSLLGIEYNIRTLYEMKIRKYEVPIYLSLDPIISELPENMFLKVQGTFFVKIGRNSPLVCPSPAVNEVKIRWKENCMQEVESIPNMIGMEDNRKIREKMREKPVIVSSKPLIKKVKSKDTAPKQEETTPESTPPLSPEPPTSPKKSIRETNASLPLKISSNGSNKVKADTPREGKHPGGVVFYNDKYDDSEDELSSGETMMKWFVPNISKKLVEDFIQVVKRKKPSDDRSVQKLLSKFAKRHQIRSSDLLKSLLHHYGGKILYKMMMKETKDRKSKMSHWPDLSILKAAGSTSSFSDATLIDKVVNTENSQNMMSASLPPFLHPDTTVAVQNGQLGEHEEEIDDQETRWYGGWARTPKHRSGVVTLDGNVQNPFNNMNSPRRDSNSQLSFQSHQVNMRQFKGDLVNPNSCTPEIPQTPQVLTKSQISHLSQDVIPNGENSETVPKLRRPESLLKLFEEEGLLDRKICSDLRSPTGRNKSAATSRRSSKDPLAYMASSYKVHSQYPSKTTDPFHQMLSPNKETKQVYYNEKSDRLTIQIRSDCEDASSCKNYSRTNDKYMKGEPDPVENKLRKNGIATRIREMMNICKSGQSPLVENKSSKRFTKYQSARSRNPTSNPRRLPLGEHLNCSQMRISVNLSTMKRNVTVLNTQVDSGSIPGVPGAFTTVLGRGGPHPLLKSKSTKDLIK